MDEFVAKPSPGMSLRESYARGEHLLRLFLLRGRGVLTWAEAAQAGKDAGYPTGIGGYYDEHAGKKRFGCLHVEGDTVAVTRDGLKEYAKAVMFAAINVFPSDKVGRETRKLFE